MSETRYWYPRKNDTRILTYRGKRYAGWQSGVLVLLCQTLDNSRNVRELMEEFESRMAPPIRRLARAICRGDMKDPTAAALIRGGTARREAIERRQQLQHERELALEKLTHREKEILGL